MRMSGRTRRVVTIGVITALVATAAPLSVLTPHTALAAPGGIIATSVSLIPSGRGLSPSVSGDGRFIAFTDGGIGGGGRAAEPGVAAAVRIALNGQGQEANSPAFGGLRQSADGRHVVFVSGASNLTPADATLQTRVYTLDRDSDADGVFDEVGFTTLRRVPGRVAASGAGGGFGFADISETGRYVAFTQPDVNGANTCLRAYRLDRDVDGNGVFDEPGTSAVIDVTVNSAGVGGTRTGGCAQGINDTRDSLSISGDGQHVLFASDFDNLVVPDFNNTDDVFVRDIAAGTTRRIPAELPNSILEQSYAAGISRTGRFVTVVGSGSNPVFRFDRDADVDNIYDEPDATTLVLVSSSGTGGSVPAMSGDGGTIAWWSPTGVRVWRPSTGEVVVLPVTLNVTGATSLNASGNVLALQTRDVFDPADVNGLEDVYRVELSAGPPVAMNVGIAAPATTPPAASEISINAISPQIVRNADFDVSTAPGGYVKRSPGGFVKRSPGGYVKRSPGGFVKRSPGGFVKRSDELSRYATVFSRIPTIQNLPLSSIPIDGGWDARLPVSLQDRPLQTITLGQLLQALGASANSIQLQELDLLDTPLANIGAAAFALGATPLNSLLLPGPTGTNVTWCTRLTQLTGRTCFGGAAPLGSFNTQTTLIELEMRADTRQLLAEHPELLRIPIRTNLTTLRTAGAPVLAETFADLGLGVSRVGDLPIATAIAAVPGIGDLAVADIGNTSLTLDCVISVCAPATTLASLQTSGQIQARGRLRDVTVAISGKTLNDVAASLPADVTLNDVLIGILEAGDFPWEAIDLVTSGIQEAAAAPASVPYQVAVSATGGTGPFDATVEVVLPSGWRFVTGSASVSPAVALPLSEPSRTYRREDTQLVFRLTGIMPNTSYTIAFNALPGFVLGTVAANASAAAAGISGGALPAAITITEPTDATADAGAAQQLQSDRLYFSYTTADTDVDLFRFNPPAGKVVSVWLSNFQNDLDLSLYGPAVDAANAPGSPSIADTRGPAPAMDPIADEGTSSISGTQIAEPQGERDMPRVAGSTLLDSSANADVDVEGVSAANANLIQVAPYQGNTSTGPYVLRVRTDDTEVAAACSYTRTGGVTGPAFDIGALPAGLETAILVHQRRLGDAMGAAAAQDLITSSLAALTTAPGVSGAIVHLDQVIDYSALDANWCNPDLANDVVRQVGSLIDQIRDARPTLRHLVIVGGDDIVPMARIDDITRTGNEAEYSNELLDANGNTPTPLTEALGTRHFLTDDPYGDVDPIAWFNRRLYVPDLAVGRLVETKAEIEATVQAYLDPNGDGNTVDAGIMPASSLYMTGYDFMADGAVATRDALNSALAEAGGAAPSSTSNISPPDGPVTEAQMLTGTAAGRAIGLFGHFSHDGALTDTGFRFNNGETVTPAELANVLRPPATPANARLVFSIGCHSGLNVPDGTPNTTDFAQRVLGTGAVYVAMTTYGYGVDGAIGLNEALMTQFAQGLDGGYVLIDRTAADTPGNRRYLSVGEAFVGAKQQYFADQGLYGPYDEKSLEAATFYGLPMFRVGSAGAPRTAPAPQTPTAAGGGAAYSVVDDSLTFSPTAVTGANGTYFTVPGFDPQVTANRPVQPRYEVDVTAVDGTGGVLYAKGVVVTDLDTASSTTIDPVITRPVLDARVNEPEIGLGDVAYPSLPASITTYTDPLGYAGDAGLLQRQQLVVVPGQFVSDATIDATGSGTQVLYGTVDTQITYSDSSDWTRPSITSTLGELANGTASFAIRASDAAGVQRVLVLVRTDISDWAPLDLTFGGTAWQGTLAVPGATTFDYLVQVVDVNGNVATSTGKGRGLDPFVAPIPEPATVSVIDGSALEGDAGTAARSVSVVLDRPAPGPITVGYTVTAGTAAAGTDFTATSGSVSLAAGDLAAAVAFDVAGDTAAEAPESVIITLTSVTAATGLLADATGTFTIVDDDAAAPPNALVFAADITVVEGNTGTQVVNVPITLSPAAAGPVALSWSIVAGGSATSFVDVASPITGTVNVAAGASTAAVPINIIGDLLAESDETVVVQVSSATPGVSVIDSTAVVTITDDDLAPTLTIADLTIDEFAGSAALTVTLSAPSASPVLVPWSTGDGTATSPDDFSGGSGTLTIVSGLTGTISIPITDDGVAEPSESFTVSIGTPGAPTGATVADGEATVTIADDDTVGISIVDTSVAEGDVPGTVAVTVSLDRPSQTATTVDWTTVDATAVSPADFVSASGTVTVPAGETTAAIEVSIAGDTIDELDETFSVQLSNPSVGAITDGVGIVTIVDDDVVVPSVLDLADVTIVEGTSATPTVGGVTVSVQPAASDDVTVEYSIVAGTATAVDDVTLASGVLLIPSGATTATIPVTLVADALDEADETVIVVLEAVTGTAAIGFSPAFVTIADDDDAPTTTLAAVTFDEAGAPGAATFTASLSAPSGLPISVDWTTAGGTATAGTDYTSASGTFTFAPGATTATFGVQVLPDGDVETDETVLISLSGAVNTSLPSATAVLTIDDDDVVPPSVITIGAVAIAEGTGGLPTTGTVPVTITPATSGTVTIAYTISAGTATGADVGLGTGLLTLPAGAAGASVPVSIVADSIDEPDETFTVALGAVTGNAVVGLASSASVTILDDDLPVVAGPQLSVADVSVLEASSGTRAARVRVSLSAARTTSTSFTWRTQNGTAVAPGDFTAIAPRTATIPAGSTSVLVDVPVRGDTVDEADETFTVIASAPSAGVSIADGTGVVTIRDDDPRPTISIADAAVVEGASGTRNLVFTVTLSAPTGDQVSAAWVTLDGSARLVDRDYVAAIGAVVFSPGQTSATVTVRVNGDGRREPDETLRVALFLPTFANIARGTATGTITNDD